MRAIDTIMIFQSLSFLIQKVPTRLNETLRCCQNMTSFSKKSSFSVLYHFLSLLFSTPPPLTCYSFWLSCNRAKISVKG